MMRKSYKLVTIFMIVTISFVSIKNNLIEYIMKNNFSNPNIKVKNISCSGVYDINCKLNNIHHEIKYSSLSYEIKIKSISLNNILSIYKSYNKKSYPQNSVSIDIQNIVLRDNKHILKNISKPIDISLNINKNDLTLKFDRENFNFNLDKNFKLYLQTENNVIHKIFYELYKIAFLEMTYRDGKDISKGLNISLGYSSNEFIPQKYFFENSLSRAIELSISEIESYDLFNKYNQNNQMSNLLEFLLKENGKKEFQFIKPIKI